MIAARARSGRSSLWKYADKSSGRSIDLTLRLECRASPGRLLDPELKINATGSITSLPRKRSLHTFTCAQVAKTRLLHEILDFPAIFNGLFNIGRQFIWNVNRKAILPAIARKCVATVADASPACRAVLANARALAQGNRTERDWPDSLQCTQEPLPNIFRCFVSVHRTCVILHLYTRVNVNLLDTGCFASDGTYCHFLLPICTDCHFMSQSDPTRPEGWDRNKRLPKHSCHFMLPFHCHFMGEVTVAIVT